MKNVKLSKDGEKTLADIIELKKALANEYMRMKELKDSARKIFEKVYYSNSDYEVGFYGDVCDSIEQMVAELEIRENEILADPDFYDFGA